MKIHITKPMRAALVGAAVVTTPHAQPAALTYQGRLNDGASPANGLYNLSFATP